MDESFDLALFEAGISKPGEMSKLEAILMPDNGIFTHLGNAHLEKFFFARGAGFREGKTVYQLQTDCLLQGF